LNIVTVDFHETTHRVLKSLIGHTFIALKLNWSLFHCFKVLIGHSFITSLIIYNVVNIFKTVTAVKLSKTEGHNAYKCFMEELSYRTQIAPQLRARYAEGIYDNPVTFKSRLTITHGH